MKKAGLFLLLLLLSAGLALGGWWLYRTVLSPLFDPPKVSLESLDLALDLGNWEGARNIIKSAAGQYQSLSEGRRLVKRALRLTEATGQDWELFRSLAEGLAQRFPGSAQAVWLQAYGLLRGGQRREAFALLPKLEDFSISGSSDMSSGLLAPLVKELKIRSGLVYPGMEGDQDFSSLIQALEDRESGRDLYAGLQSVLENKGILQNTLLLFLREGRYPEVLNYLGKDRSGLRTPLLKALIFYDAGQWERALQVLRDLPERETDLAYLLLLADLTAQVSGREAAAVVYRKMVSPPEAQHPAPLEVSPIPYLNLATLLEEQGSDLAIKEARQHLLSLNRPGMEALSGDMESLKEVFLLELEYRQGGSGSVGARLLKDGLTPDLEILRYRLFPEYLSLPRLFFLFKNTPEPALDRVTEALVWNLLIRQDYSRALEVLKDWENLTGPPAWWTAYYRSILHALRQDPEASERSLEDVPPRWRDFGYFYNLGVIRWAKKTPEGRAAALEAWEEGRTAISGLGIRSLREKDRLFSRLYLRLAESFEALGNQEKARDYSRLARLLDESNHSAYFLEKRLQGDSSAGQKEMTDD